MCPHLSNLNHNKDSEINAPNVVTDLSNISNQDYESDLLRTELSSVDVISSNNSNNSNSNYTNSNRNGLTKNSTTTSITTTTATTPSEESRIRHSSMDRLMSLLNDLGNTTRTRSLSDGGQEEGKI